MRRLIPLLFLLPATVASGADWVFFADRGLTARGRESALAATEVAMPQHTAWRRAKMDGPRVQEGDLPPNPDYVAAVAATGARVRVQTRWLNGISVEATRSQLAAIATLPFVRAVMPVARFSRPEPSSVSMPAAPHLAPSRPLDYGASLGALAQIRVPAVHDLGLRGQGVVIGMLDTGFWTDHECLRSLTVLAAHDFLADDDVVEDQPGDPLGQHDHGTKTLSTVAGFRPGAIVGPAYGAAVILAKTEDTSQEVPIEEDYWVAGLEWVEWQGADVVSSSLGYSAWYEFADLDGNTAVTTIAADLAAARGVCVVNSAGNDRHSAWGHLVVPADGDDVIAVGAVNLAGDVAYFSSPGPTYDGRIKPDVCALGVATPVADPADQYGYTTASGTSLSCPLAAGVAALVLCRAPSLTPLQVREALRATADNAAAPDNDRGWGVLDAFAAVHYWGPRVAHVPLRDTENTVRPYIVAATITDRLPLEPAERRIRWRAGGGFWKDSPALPIGGGAYVGAIPDQPAGTDVVYYLEVTDSQGVTTRDPLGAPDQWHAFHVGPDTTPPTLAHLPLGTQPLVSWPPVVQAQAADNLGLARVELTWRLGAQPWQGPVNLSPAGDGSFALSFPVAATVLSPGLVLTYMVTAWDAAIVPNASVSGPHAFTVVDAPGVVLVIDDGGGQRLGSWLQDAGYVVDTAAPAAVDAAALAAHQVAVLATGANPQPIADASLRTALRAYPGKLLVEGGEVGAAADASFAREVLRIDGWEAHRAGPLQAVVAAHPVLTYPHALPTTMPVAADGEASQDACTPATDALLLMAPAGWPGSVGLLAYDDNDVPQAGQLVYLACDAGALAEADARHLIENAVAYLLAPEAPAAATIAGRVTLSNADDASGARVAAGGHVAVTGAEGLYVLGPLEQGSYVVTATHDGYLAASRPVAVAHAQQLAGIDLTLVPAQDIALVDRPELAIPDGGALVRPLAVTASGPCAEVSVDIVIAHPRVGDLVVTLIGPSGTTVRLRDRSGGEADDLAGNWPRTLRVDGPGSLDDFRGQEAAGAWRLVVLDAAIGEAGTWVSWGLHLRVPAATTPVAPADGPPLATRLLGNAPNPFNPRTELSFEIAAAGAVGVEVFDARGRRVRLLLDATLPAGHHATAWDGRDDAGREVASGAYLARLTAGGASYLGKMTLLR